MAGFTFSLQQAGQQHARPGKPIHTETDHYLLRSLTAADVTPEFAGWFDDPLMLQGLNLPALNFSEDGLRAFVASFDNHTNYLIGIFSKEGGQLMGFYNFSVNLKHRVASVTVGASPNAKIGRPLFWETMMPMYNALFEHTTVEKISGRILMTNRRMLFAIMGGDDIFCEGIFRQEILGPDGKRLDVMAIARFKDKSMHEKKKDKEPAHA